MSFRCFLIPALLGAFMVHGLFAPALVAGPTHEIVAGFESYPSNPPNDSLVFSDGYLWGTTTSGGNFSAGAAYKIRPDGTGCELVHSFASASGSSRSPSGLEPDGLGFLWGVTAQGGLGGGVLFKIDASTGAYTVIRNASQFSSPTEGLANDGAGFLWGTTGQGGTNNASTIFKVNAATGAYSQVASFSGSAPGNNGRTPKGRLVSDGAGFFWGATNNGGTSDLGTVFKVNATTGALTIVANFTGNGETEKGAGPLGGLVYDGQGFMWGTTSKGGAGDFGTVFKVNAGTGELITVVEFTNNGASNIGRSPAAALFADGAGRLWGTTELGGSNDTGTIFRIAASTGILSTILECPSGPVSEGGRIPSAPLTDGGDGFLYGTTRSGGSRGSGTVFRVSLETSLVTTIYAFSEIQTAYSGRFPIGGLTDDGNGFLWGTTLQGGERQRGTVFKMDPLSGQVSTVVEFTGEGDRKGWNPQGMLLADGHGFLWGTTLGGGADACGTIFKVDALSGAIATVVEFEKAGEGSLGSIPHVGLTPDGNGHLWGTTFSGGNFNHGTIFKVDRASGAVTKVHDFAKDGALNPGSKSRAALCADRMGYLWGTTTEGGTGNYGTVFKIKIATGEFTHVLSFSDNGVANKGRTPRGALIHDGAGTLWGTTYGGGTSGRGTVYKINAATGALTTVSSLVVQGLHAPTNPAAPVMDDGAGNYWGTTSNGGPADDGTIFKVNAATGATSLIFSFSSFQGSGAHPGYGGLCKFADNHFYGVVTEGGPYGAGVVYRLRFGPKPATGEAESISATGATLRGTIAQNGTATTATFEWGTDPALAGGQVAQATVIGTPADPASAASATLGGLAPATTYYYRLTAVNAENVLPQHGAIASFTTLPNEPPVVTLNGSTPITLEAAVSYTDPGATATDTEDGVLVPAITANTVQASVPGNYVVTWTATDSHGASAAATRAVVIEDTTAPSLEGEFAPGRVVAGTLLADYRDQAVTSDVVGVVAVMQTPLPGTALVVGTTEVIITAKDAAGNEASLTFFVAVRPAAPEVEAIVAGGAPLPGAGADPRIAEGSKWVGFGAPAVSDAGALAFVGRWAGVTRTAQAGTGIFVDGNLLVKAGDPVPGAGANGVPPAAVFKSFKDPVVSGEGIAFIATLAGAGMRADADTAVFSTDGAGNLEMIAREGGEAPGANGALFKSFANVSIQSGASIGTLFTATLRSAKGGSPVTAANDAGAWWKTGAEPLRKLVREGDPGFTGDELIHSFQLLQAISGSTGQGRGHLAEDVALFRINTKNGRAIRQRLVLGAPGSLTEIASAGEDIQSTQLPGAKWAAMGLPSASADGVHAGLLGMLAVDGATIVKSNAKGIFATDDFGDSWEPIARIGGPVEGFPETASYTRLYDPVHSSTGAAMAFMGTVKGSGIPGNANDGIWWRGGSGPAQLLVRKGNQPPDAPEGARWKSFSSVAFPGGDMGPLFVGNLVPGFPAGANRVTAKNDSGLYAVDSFGAVRELLREGQFIQGKAVKSFVILKAALGSAGASRSFNAEGHVGVLVTLNDGSKAILRLTIP